MVNERSVDSSADRFLPQPRAGWYDPEIGSGGGGVKDLFAATVTADQRRSYVRFILTGQRDHDEELAELADWEPSALAPWADHVTEFDDVALARLSKTVKSVGRASLGASAAAVDRLAEKIAATASAFEHRSPDGPFTDRVDLLIGADTDHALTRLAELGRRFRRWTVNEICRSRGVWISANGRAERRYVSQPQVIVREDGQPESRLRVLPPVDEILLDPRGRRCPIPFSVLLDLDLALLPGTALTAAAQRTQPFLASFCDECEADEVIGDSPVWRLVTDGPAAGRFALQGEREADCTGYMDPEEVWDMPRAVALRGSRRPRAYSCPGFRAKTDEVGVLGGRPAGFWGTWPVCCDKPMFYVGEIYSFLFISGYRHAHLYGFACECGTGRQVSEYIG